ncbi:MAG: ABC transporter ATP-binding protein [Nitrospirae bacterium]|nr:ABC transporter ATP-binding protein [Nitrospirota bacterium]
MNSTRTQQMIILEDVAKNYGDTHVLKGITLEVRKGEFLSVTGSSGSGKSTLLNLIGGMDRPDSGKILVGGEDITAYTDDALTLYRRKKIGFIFQFFNLFPNISVFENVRIPLLLNEISDEEAVRRYIARVGLEGKERRYPYQLSGGEQQRVAIARALVHDPEIILADEPTGSLDSRTGTAIMDLVRELAGETRKTVVLVTHEAHISAYAQREVGIRDGSIV